MATVNRREFLKSNVFGAVGLALGKTGIGLSGASDKVVRVGIVGTGGRGRSLLGDILAIPQVQVPALCDINIKNLNAARDMVVGAGQTEPDGYFKNEYSFKKLMERDDLDAVIIATPWKWHTPMAVYCMKAGKYTAVEVPAAFTIEQCWELVNTYEETRTPCMMLENWSFRRDNLAVLKMIRAGLFGQIVHCHCAHSHDCIDHWFFDAETGQDRWPAEYLLKHNRDLYPTHQLGPVISWMDIGCGDYFDYLTSTASEPCGINDYFRRKFGPEHPNAKRTYKQGDIVSTVVKTKKGKTIVINYDMQLPRPYDNRWMVQGTRGLYNEQRNAVYITGKSSAYHEWELFGPYQNEYDHGWYKTIAGGSGEHGGTDYLEMCLFLQAARNKTNTPLDIYDSVIMCVTGPLSEESIAKGSVPVNVPDFTGGKWETKKPNFALEKA